MALKCPNPKCKNHGGESTDDNRFRGVQLFRPQSEEEKATGAERVKQGSEEFYCYTCGTKATGNPGADNNDDDEDALLPAPPSRPLKPASDETGKKEDPQ